MNQARVTWLNDMQFVAETGSGHAVVLESGGKNRAPSPMEMLLVGMAGCTAVDVVHILNRMRQPVTNVRVNVKGDRAEKPPRVYTDIEVEYEVTGHGLSEEKVRRAVEMSETTYCSASIMLGKTATITSTIRILDADTESPPVGESAARVAELEKQLADLQSRMPAHSVPPSMIVELDELEEELALARRQLGEEGADGAAGPPGGGN